MVRKRRRAFPAWECPSSFDFRRMQGQNPEKPHFNVEPTLDWSAYLAMLRYQRGAGERAVEAVKAAQVREKLFAEVTVGSNQPMEIAAKSKKPVKKAYRPIIKGKMRMAGGAPGSRRGRSGRG
jgi:hypothetical protein